MQDIEELKKIGFDVWLEGDKIRYRQTREQIDQSVVESLLTEIKCHKDEAIRYLLQEPYQQEIISQSGHKPGHEGQGKNHQAFPLKDICPLCRESEWWISISNKKICAICHPPASDRLVKSYLK